MGHHNPDSPSHLKHYFHDVNQQYETSKFAMWAFILTEVLTFAGLFVAYIVYRSWYPDMFVDAHKLLDVNKGLNEYNCVNHKFSYYGFSNMGYSKK